MENKHIAQLSGIEQLRALQAEGRIAGIADTLKFRLEDLEEGRVTFEGDPGPHAFNPIGTVHGGYAATLLDFGLRLCGPFQIGSNASIYDTRPAGFISQSADGQSRHCESRRSCGHVRTACRVL